MAPHRKLRPPLRVFVALGFLVLLLLAWEMDERAFRHDSLDPPTAGDFERFPYLNPALDTEARIEMILERMTLDEKVEQMHGIGQMRTPTNFRLRIPSFQTTDGPHGVGEAVWRYIFRDLDRATTFPVSVALGASWDEDLARRLGEAIAREARAKGRNWLLAPDINLIRDPRAGRTFESFSEDPHLTARLGVAYVEGVQATGMIATPKHFAAHNQETWRRDIDVEVSERALRELYLPAFRAAVREAGAWSVMAASHSVNGNPCTSNAYLLGEVLKGDWEFDGVVVSDWKCVSSSAPSLRAGLDLEMPYPIYYGPALLPELDKGEISLDRIDDAVRRILRLKIRAGLFDEKRTLDPRSVHTEEHGQLALDIARSGLVLLRNEDGALPLDTSSGRIVVSGPNAARARKGGGGSSEVRGFEKISPLEGLLREAPEGLIVEHVECCEEGAVGPSAIGAVADAASGAEAAILVLGLSMDHEGEGLDRVGLTLDLPEPQRELVEAVAAVQARTIVVLVAGSAVSMPWLDDVPAVLAAWYPGERGGTAIAEVVYGDVNPSGRLSFTFPASVEQIPGHEDFGDKAAPYREGIFMGYRHYDRNGLEPLFPFGHGLGYTTFGYANLEVGASVDNDSAASVSFDVTNTGPRTGTEVAQVYLGDAEASIEREVRSLAAFRRLTLEPGETRRVEVGIPHDALRFWHPEMRGWMSEPGEFRIAVGRSSQDLRLAATVELPRSRSP